MKLNDIPDELITSRRAQKNFSEDITTFACNIHTVTAKLISMRHHLTDNIFHTSSSKVKLHEGSINLASSESPDWALQGKTRVFVPHLLGNSRQHVL